MQRSLNSVIGGSSDSIYLIIHDLGNSSGEGLDFINGQTWLERFYTVYGQSHELHLGCWVALIMPFRGAFKIRATVVALVWPQLRTLQPLPINHILRLVRAW
jgi:hypothetical protein